MSDTAGPDALFAMEGGGDAGDAGMTPESMGLGPMDAVSLAAGPYRTAAATRRTRPQEGDNGTFYYKDHVRPKQPPPFPPMLRASRVQQMRESLELRWLDLQHRWEPVMERWWRRRHAIRRAVCCLVGLLVLVAWAAGSFSDPAGYVAEEARPTWARAGQAGVDFSAVSAEVTCGELETGSLARTVSPAEEPSLARLRAYADHVLAGSGPDTPPCVCAPMFGTRRQYLALRQPARPGAVTHMYNPAIDGLWDGHLPDGRRPASTGRSLVSESQQMLFPGRAGPVENVRQNAIRLTYRDESCHARAVVLQTESAWCVQVCIDLMAGVTVYQRAAGDSPE